MNEEQCKSKFLDIYNRHGEDVRQMVRRFTPDPDRAADIFQDIFLNLWKNRTALHAIDNIKGYLYVMVSNHFRSFMREQRRLQPVPGDGSFADRVNPFEILIARQLNESYSLSIDKLPTAMRLAYLLRHESELSGKETARELKLSYHTVKCQLYQAQKRIRERLEIQDI